MERRYIIVGFSANWSTLLKAHFILKSVEGCSRTLTNLQTLTITCFLTEQELIKNSYPESGLKHQLSNNTLSLEMTMSWVACCLITHCTISFIMMVYGAAVHIVTCDFSELSGHWHQCNNFQFVLAQIVLLPGIEFSESCCSLRFFFRSNSCTL